MAIIGFITLVLIGLYFAWNAAGITVLSLGFTGKLPWLELIFFGGISAGALYVAFTNMPLTISIAT
jgi:hypothetical protein